MSDGVWVRPDKVIAVREGRRGESSYVVLENVPDEIWVSEPIDTTLARIGWTR